MSFTGLLVMLLAPNPSIQFPCVFGVVLIWSDRLTEDSQYFSWEEMMSMGAL